MNILALEIGTAAIRAAVVDVNQSEIRGPIAQMAVAMASPTSDAAEFSATHLWQALAATARRAVQDAGVSGQAGGDIAGIGLSTFMPGLVLLDKDDQPLTPIWTHLDRRARPAARQVWAHMGDEFHATTGNRPLPGLVSALSWRQQHSADPYLSHRVHAYLHVGGWLAFHMTGAKAFDPANACSTGLFSTLTDQAWSPRWCDYFEVEPAWLPAIVDGRVVVGTVRAAIASELGVPAGIPVKLGTDDLGMMMLATSMEPGDVLHVVGATEALATLTQLPGPGPRRLVHRLGVGSQFVHTTFNPVGVAALAWLRRLCFSEQGDAEFHEKTLSLARQRSTRISLDPPFLAGDCLEIEASRAAFRDLDLNADRLELLATLLRTVSLRHREALANLGLRTPPRRVVVIGASVDSFRRLYPDYETCHLDAASIDPLCGVARLFSV